MSGDLLPILPSNLPVKANTIGPASILPI